MTLKIPVGASGGDALSWEGDLPPRPQPPNESVTCRINSNEMNNCEIAATLMGLYLGIINDSKNGLHGEGHRITNLNLQL